MIAIQVYSFDPVVEEAAFDLGATRWQVMKEVTLPLLAPGIFSGFTFSFLLSWANFPLSLFSSGADSTIPEWISAKIQSGYTPQVPAVGSLTMGAAAAVMILGYGLMMLMAWRKTKARIGLIFQSRRKNVLDWRMLAKILSHFPIRFWVLMAEIVLSLAKVVVASPDGGQGAGRGCAESTALRKCGL